MEKEISKKINIGDEAGSLKTNTTRTKSYFEVGFSGIALHVHRVIYCLFSGQDLEPTFVIDHIDGNGLNNNTENLRAVSQSENVRNRCHKVSNTGEHNITEYVTAQYFVVSYTEDSREFKVHFTYTLRGLSDNPRAFKDRSLALVAAIKYRDQLIELGKIYKVKT